MPLMVIAVWAVVGGLGLVGYELFSLVNGVAYDVLYLGAGIVLAALGVAGVVYLIGRKPIDIR